MEFEPATGNLNLLAWGLCKSYKPTPDPEAGFEYGSYVANLTPFCQYENGSYGFYSGYQRVLCAGKLDPATQQVVLEGQYEPNSKFTCVGVECALSMGGPSGSQTVVPIQIIEPKYRYVKNGVEYVPYTLAPYIMTRVSTSTAKAPAAPAQTGALELKKMDGKRTAPAATQQTTVRGQFPITKK